MSWKIYRNDLERIREAFPGCRPFEINLLGYESTKPTNPLKVHPNRCFQISTNAYDDGKDLWNDFSLNNWAYTGGPGKGRWSEYTPDGGQKQYPIDQVQKGDILLVRFANQGHGVGVVYRNDFRRRLADDARLHLIWVNKRATKLSSGPRALGFGYGHGKIGDAFRQAYPETFRVLDRLYERTEPPTGANTPPPHTSVVKHALATILYGPPGTGKTYATVRRCVEICDGKAPKSLDDRRARYDRLVDQGRIEFVTFHAQSYSNEDFVEGLRPVASVGEGSGLRLEVIKGVLRRIAERARKVPEIGGRRIFKMSLGDPHSWGGTPQGNKIFLECIDSGCVLLLEYGGDIDWSDAVYGHRDEIFNRWRSDKDADATAYNTDIQAMWRFRTEMRQGDIVVVSHGYRHFRAVGEICGDYEFQPRKDGFHHRRAVQWHWQMREGQGEPASVFRDGPFQWRPINLLTPANPEGLLPFLNGVGEIGGTRPHVLVIDEINRANISKVMGELITLLEEDKREDAENEVAVTLPYSRERFTLPANLYVLGTMNTADRSIALLDTALRRRFHFKEMPPDPNLLKELREQTGVDLPQVLRTMNERLEYLVDRDHRIGHAWFMRVKTRDDVDAVMRHKIIPLIAEYFYDDWSKARAILGGSNHFVERRVLRPPPDLGSDLGEDRYQWTVRETFDEDAYKRLIGTNGQDEDSE